MQIMLDPVAVIVLAVCVAVAMVIKDARGK